MRPILLFLSVVTFASCSKYQYYNLTSDNVPKNQKQQFVFDNDTCRITYDFSGWRGPVSVSIYNKTNKSLEIDWKRSAVIIGDSSISLFEPDMKFDGEVERSRYTINQNVSGTLSQPESLDFIPPHASVMKKSRNISSKYLKLSQADGRSLKTANQKMRVYEFSKEKSPVVFRTYLTLMQADRSFNIDNGFYANQIIETKAAPENFGKNSADRFYIKSKTDLGKVSTAVFGVGLTVLLIAAL